MPPPGELIEDQRYIAEQMKRRVAELERIST